MGLPNPPFTTNLLSIVWRALNHVLVQNLEIPNHSAKQDTGTLGSALKHLQMSAVAPAMGELSTMLASICNEMVHHMSAVSLCGLLPTNSGGAW